jgi:hypothetical protein
MFYFIRCAKELKGKSAYGRVYKNEHELAKKIPNLNYIHNIKLKMFWVVVDIILTTGLLPSTLLRQFASQQLAYGTNLFFKITVQITSLASSYRTRKLL